MGQIFLNVLDLSAKASVLIIAVVLLRLALKKAPRHLICLLWLLVGLRLVLPFSVESTLSLVPSAAPVSSRVELSRTGSEIVSQQELVLPNAAAPNTQPDASAPEINLSNTPVYTPENNPDPVAAQPQQSASRPVSMSPEQIAAVVWLCGLAAMLAYLALSYALLRRKLAVARPVAEGVWSCSGLDSPFVLGFFRPGIYLCDGLSEGDAAYVLAHERAHIARRDHITKPLAFVVLAVHWFNPLVWLGYLLLCRDIELACDERVVKDMDLDRRKAYSLALLACSVRAKPLAACPLAFGEVGVKQRIKSVLSYKKPAFWIIIAAVLCIIVSAVLFMTDPRENLDSPEEYTAALLEQHRDRLYMSDLEIDRTELFESAAEDTVFEKFYLNGENYCNGTNTNNVYYWHDPTGEATSAQAAKALVEVMLQSINSLPEDERSFTILEYEIEEQSLTSWEDMPARLLDGFPIDVEGLDDAEALAEIDRVFEEHLSMEQDLFGFDAFVMDLGEDMWVFDPEFTFDYEGLCNMYRREEMEKYGLVAENGLCVEVQQGSDGYFVHILIKNGDVWRLQRLNGLIEYMAGDPDPTPVTTPQPDGTSAQLPDLPGFINADTMYLPYLFLNGDKENIVDIPYEYHAGLTAGAVEILTNGNLVKYTQEEFDSRASQLSGGNIVELRFSGRNISFILDELGYYIEYTVSAFTNTKVRFYAGDNGTLAAIENLLKDIPQVEYVYLDVDDPEEYVLSNGLSLGQSYTQIRLILGEGADISYEHNEIGTMYCLNYNGIAKLYMFAESGGDGFEDLENSRLMFVQYYAANMETARGISSGDSWSQVYSAYGIERSEISGDRLPVGAAWSIPVNSRDTSVFALIPEDPTMWENGAPPCMFFLFEGDVLSSIYLRPATAIDWQPTLTSAEFSIPVGTAYDPGMFYPLAVPMGSSIAADLDGDGIDELIYQNFNNIPYEDLFFTINGVDFSDIVDVHSLHRGSYYITDLERTDGKLEITVYDEGPSGDPVVYFFQYYDNELHFVGDIPWWFDQLRFDGDSYVLGAFRLSILQTWFAGAAWRYADGQLQFIEQDFYHALERETVLDWTTGKEIEHHYALCDMYVYASKNLSSQPLVLRAGTQFDLLGTDNVEWILLKTLDGEQYWLHAGLDNPDGITNSMDIIAGLDMSD